MKKGAPQGRVRISSEGLDERIRTLADELHKLRNEIAESTRHRIARSALADEKAYPVAYRRRRIRNRDE